MAMFTLHSVGNAQYDRRDGHECQQGGHDKGQGPIALLHDKSRLTCQSFGKRYRPKGRWGHLARVDATQFQFLLCPEHGDSVTRDDLMVPAGTLGHLSTIARHDRHWSQVAEVSTKSGLGCFGIGHLHLDDRESHTAQFDIVGIAPQTGFYERRTSQRGDVEHAAPSRYSFERPGDRRIRQLDHHSDIGTNLPDAECGLQGVYFLGFDADHRECLDQTCFKEGISQVGVSMNVRDSPFLQYPGESGVGIIVHHDHRCSTESELLDDPESDSLESTHDHVVTQPQFHLRFHDRMFSS